jgi:hypothetical protein
MINIILDCPCECDTTNSGCNEVCSDVLDRLLSSGIIKPGDLKNHIVHYQIREALKTVQFVSDVVLLKRLVAIENRVGPDHPAFSFIAKLMNDIQMHELTADDGWFTEPK